MTQRDLAALRRRLNPEKNDVSVIRGCYVNENREIVSTFSKSPLSLPQSEAEHYLGCFKKTLAGAPGRNRFSIPVHLDEERGLRLRKLQQSELKDEGAVEALFRGVIESLEIEGAYLILAMHDAFSLPKKNSAVHADAPDLSDEVFSYVAVAVCPVRLTKPQLTFFSDDRDFHTVEPDLAVAPPALGFVYPEFSDGGADVNRALYYTRDAEDIHADFIDGVFAAQAPDSAADRKQSFYGVLGDSLENGLTFDVVQAIHENVNAQLAERKRDAGPLRISRGEIASLLSTCDVSEANRAAFEEAYLEQFGAVGIEADAIAEPKKFEISAGEDVKIEISGDRSDLVEMKRVDGRRVIVIAVEGDVTVNGVEVNV